jgi:hypothetical protein
VGDTLEAQAEWGNPHHAVERDRFLVVFNDVSDRADDVKSTASI